MHFNVRLAQQKDIANLSDVLMLSFYCDRKGEFAAFTKWLFPFIRWGISLDLGNRLTDAPPHYACFVATQLHSSNRAIGILEMGLRGMPDRTSKFSFYNWYALQSPYLFNLAVHPEWRRRGVAERLLVAAEKMALRWGWQQVYLHVLEDNQPARHLYHQSGYQLYKIDTGLSFHLLGKPRRLLLRKAIN